MNIGDAVEVVLSPYSDVRNGERGVIVARRWMQPTARNFGWWVYVVRGLKRAYFVGHELRLCA